MTNIKKAAVIGSGVMGAAIAAHFANAGIPVVLLDIVPEEASNRNMLAEQAIERLLKTDPAPLTHKRKAKLITPGNLNDHLHLLKDVDWIVEAVLEKLEVKQALYKKLDTARKPGSIVSSNTSTLPLHVLVEGMPDKFQRDFLIAHFFNPPRYMHLLELVGGAKTRPEALEAIRKFGDITLGKGVVDCKDTPGFIANRIGCFWMTVAMLEAIRLGISVEEADAVMSKPIGVPKTGVFGLMDLIGIDLLPLIAKAMWDSLPEKDAFREVYNLPDVVKNMIENGYTGRKGRGGFYRLNIEGGKKEKEVVNLQNGSYASAGKPKVPAAEAAKEGLRALVEFEDLVGEYAKSVLVQTLGYAASLIPEIADDIPSVDRGMRWGYNWKYGPFELIDKLSTQEQSGAAWLAAELEKLGKPVPAILREAGNRKLYMQDDTGKQHIDLKGKYKAIPVSPGMWTLADKKLGKKPILKNASAALWDVGDGIVCLEYTSKMNSVDPLTLEMIAKTTDLVKKEYKGLIIGNDSDNFCVGANIGFLLFSANIASWKMLEDVIKQGQDVYMGLKYAPFPVVCAVSGMALGGGCEVLLHADGVQAHVETYTGLVEVGVGVIPGWGGCKEMLLRHSEQRMKETGAIAKLGRMFSMIPIVKTANMMPAVSDAFQTIAMARVSKSAEEARDMMVLRQHDRISMNRQRLLADAKNFCLELAHDYQPPAAQTITLPGKTAKAALYMAIASFAKSGKATPHDVVVSRALAEVLSGGDTSMLKSLSEQQLLDLERKAFMELIKTEGTLNRIEHMLETGKPLRN